MKATVEFAKDLRHRDILGESVCEDFEFDDVRQLGRDAKERGKQLGLPYITVHTTRPFPSLAQLKHALTNLNDETGSVAPYSLFPETEDTIRFLLEWHIKAPQSGGECTNG